jgi:hypothetical protein
MANLNSRIDKLEERQQPARRYPIKIVWPDGKETPGGEWSKPVIIRVVYESKR